MSCKGICHRYKADKPLRFGSRYGLGQKRCTACDIFINWDGKRCPCCSYALRTRPKGTQSRQQLMLVKKVKRI